MSNTSIALLTLTVAAGGAVAANRFVTQAGVYPAAGAAAFGVARTSAAGAGDLLPVDVQGTSLVETGAEISALDTHLMVDGTGRVVPLTSGGKHAVGRAMATAGAAGQIIEVLLLPSNGVANT